MLLTVKAKREQVLARRKQAEAGLRQAEVLLSHVEIRAPFSGVLVRKQIEQGDLASQGTALATIEDNRHYRLEVSVGESDLPKVGIGQKTVVRLNAIDLELEGVVSEIAASTHQSSRTTTVKIDVPLHPELRSGMFGRAHFTTGSASVLALPASALVERGQLTGVFVLDSKDRARFRLVKTGRKLGDKVEILSGIRDSEQVLVEQNPRVQDGTRISPESAQR
jgi:RND family efflux transporter MFP subunit